MSIEATVRQYLAQRFEGAPLLSEDQDRSWCNNFNDWFCKDTSLPNRQKKLDVKVRRLAKSSKIDQDKMYVWYKNNAPISGEHTMIFVSLIW